MRIIDARTEGATIANHRGDASTAVYPGIFSYWTHQRLTEFLDLQTIRIGGPRSNKELTVGTFYAAAGNFTPYLLTKDTEVKSWMARTRCTISDHDLAESVTGQVCYMLGKSHQQTDKFQMARRLEPLWNEALSTLGLEPIKLQVNKARVTVPGASKKDKHKTVTMLAVVCGHSRLKDARKVLHQIKHPLLEFIPVTLKSRRTMVTFRKVIQQHLQLCQSTKAFKIEGLDFDSSSKLEQTLGSMLNNCVVDLERRKTYLDTGVAFVQYHEKMHDHVKEKVTEILNHLEPRMSGEQPRLCSPTNSWAGSIGGSGGTETADDGTVGTAKDWLASTRFSQWEFEPMPDPLAPTTTAGPSSRSYSEVASEGFPVGQQLLAQDSENISAISSPNASIEGSDTTASTNNSTKSHADLCAENASLNSKLRKQSVQLKSYAREQAEAAKQIAALKEAHEQAQKAMEHKDRTLETTMQELEKSMKEGAELRKQMQETLEYLKTAKITQPQDETPVKRKPAKQQKAAGSTGPTPQDLEALKQSSLSMTAAVNRAAEDPPNQEEVMELDKPGNPAGDPGTVMPSGGPN
jgi:hypothetical protein